VCVLEGISHDLNLLIFNACYIKNIHRKGERNVIWRDKELLLSRVGAIAFVH
jgi:hypothetical protein